MYLTDPATRDALLSRAVEHAGMVLIAVGIGALAGLALGALASRSPAATRIGCANGSAL